MKIKDWIIVALSIAVLVLTITLLRVWPPEYVYSHSKGLLVRVHRGDGKTAVMSPGQGGWVDLERK